MDFIIKSGNHYSNQTRYKLSNFFNTKQSVSYEVIFDQSCKYTLPQEDQADINKLFGFSLGFNHHSNSGRFGWVYQNDKIEIHAYIYDSGKRKSKFLKSIELNTTCFLSLTDLGEDWRFEVDNDVQVKMPKLADFQYGYNLWLYFGGNNVTPHDIRIQMVKIY